MGPGRRRRARLRRRGPQPRDRTDDRLDGRGDGVRRRDDRQHRVPGHRALVSRERRSRPVVGPQRLQHRLRGVPASRRAGWPTSSAGGGSSSAGSSCSRSRRRCARSRRRPARWSAFRVLQALGAALLVPSSLALVLEAFPAERRSHGVALLSAVAARGGRARPVARRAAGRRRRLAARVPRQRADRRRGRRARAPPPGREPGAGPAADARPAGRARARAGDRALVLGVVKGEEWGWLERACWARSPRRSEAHPARAEPGRRRRDGGQERHAVRAAMGRERARAPGRATTGRAMRPRVPGTREHGQHAERRATAHSTDAIVNSSSQLVKTAAR